MPICQYNGIAVTTAAINPQIVGALEIMEALLSNGKGIEHCSNQLNRVFSIINLLNVGDGMGIISQVSLTAVRSDIGIKRWMFRGVKMDHGG